ncbi:MAG: sorbosone dehydrogenase family protein [Cyclobacteriaceae bacterium]|nr:sorbosone dehydrogenase family protein [Cyclobacteriaceae bacterium]
MNISSALKISSIIVIISITISVPVIGQKDTKSPSLPAPYATKSAVKFSKVVGWENGLTPKAPDGFKVTAYATVLENPRWMYALPNGDLLVAEVNTNHGFFEKIGAGIIGASKSNSMKNSANRITLLRDTDKDGVVDLHTPYLTNLNQPFGMLVLGKWFYVANTDGVYRYPYVEGETKITGTAEKIAELPPGKRHWAKTIIANADGTKIFIGSGSGTNVAEDGIDAEYHRACILEMNPDGKELKVFASGLRNPQGLDWSTDGTLWTAVNERDELGDDLVPDYFTHVERDGFYGWPYVYLGNHIDPRVKVQNKELADRTIVPDVLLGSHTASLGLAFYKGNKFPEKYHNGAFIGQHGSWNRSTLSGYKVIFIPFKDGKPSGPQEDFLSGFVEDLAERKVHGRPVGVTLMPDGALMVADDVSNTVWRVSVK